MAKYLDENMTLGERKQRERKLVQARLYAPKQSYVKHECSMKELNQSRGSATRKRVQTPKPKGTVKMELREVEDPVSMYDESNSAHQFSLKEASAQCDKEEQLEAMM